MERLLARQLEEMKAAQEEMKSDINAQAAARHDQFKVDIKGHMEAVLIGLGSCSEGTTTCQREETSCSQKSKFDPDVMEAALDTYKEISHEM
jgi:hypothetical protein